MEGRQEQFSEHNITMIPVKEDMSHLFKINEALVNQEIVSMPADRVMGSSKTIPTEFLGKTAHFPSGPFAVATMRNLEVLAINVIRISRKKYKIFVVPLAYDKPETKDGATCQEICRRAGMSCTTISKPMVQLLRFLGR